MPSYTKHTVAELRQLCDDRQILCDGLLKPSLIQALREYDEAHEGNDCELQNMFDADKGDLNLGSDEEHDEMLGEGGLPQRADDNGAGDSESVSSFQSSGDRPAISSRERELRLELEIQRARMTSAREEFEREKERRLWQQQQPQSRPIDVGPFRSSSESRTTRRVSIYKRLDGQTSTRCSRRFATLPLAVVAERRTLSIASGKSLRLCIFSD